MNPSSIISTKWDELTKNDEILKGIIQNCKNETVNGGGGILYLKYERVEDTMPTWAFVPRSDTQTWEYLKGKINNFTVLEEDYDPKKHCLMFLTIPGAGQLVRVSFSDCENISSVGDTTWNFKIV